MAEALGIGTQRRFTALAGNVFYTPPGATDFTPSELRPGRGDASPATRSASPST